MNIQFGFIEYKIGENIARETVLEQYPGRKALPIVVDKHGELVVLSKDTLSWLNEYIWRTQ